MAAETYWTPGPWQAHSLMVSEVGKPIGRGHDICHCGLGMRPNREVDQSEANAQLIAAAPDLYEALQRLDRFGHTDATWDYALRAMAKARGEQP